MSSKKVFLFVMCLGFAITSSTLALAQTSSGSDQGFTEVVTLLEAKIPESVILNKIKTSGVAYKLSTDQIIRLKKLGASEAVMMAMMSPGAEAAPSTAASTSIPPTASKVTPEASTFPEIGVYYKKGGEWQEVLPEIINWKTGGVIKGIASAGIVKKDINGHIPGPHSRNSVAFPAEFTIYTPEGVAITEYQLIRLRAHPDKDYREFRTVTGGVFNQKSGAMRDIVPFESKRSAPRQFSVLLPSALGAGEYGFIHMGSTGASGGLSSMSMGKMFTFRVIE